MRFPVTSSPSNIENSPNPKPSFPANTAPRTTFFNPSTIPNLCYEPTSVLDLRRSPSPVKERPLPRSSEVPDINNNINNNNNSNNNNSGQWEDHVLLHNLEDWDSIMRDLGLDDDSIIPPSQPSVHHMQLIPTDFSISAYPNASTINNSSPFDLSDCSYDYVEELIKAAGCFDSNELQLAQAILSRLNQRLRSPAGKPLQRAAFYFKEALNFLLSSNRPVLPLSSSEIVQTIKAYKAFSSFSPIPMFSNFTSNQALLEAINESTFIHVIDFDIGIGGKYASFLKEISDQGNGSALRVTAIVPEEYATESRLVRDNLCQFAQELRVGFHIEFVSLNSFETLRLKSVKFIDGERLAVHLSPTIFHRIGSGFLNDLRRVSSSVVVFVDSEGSLNSGTTSFTRSFVEGLEFYSIMLESLDAASGACGSEWVKKIEMFLLRPKILAGVEAYNTGHNNNTASLGWREVLSAAGMRPIVLTQFADFQAECLLRKSQVRGFHVAKHHGELVLCWHGRPLVATSAWRF